MNWRYTTARHKRRSWRQTQKKTTSLLYHFIVSKAYSCIIHEICTSKFKKKTHIITMFFQVQVHVNSKMDFLNELARFDQLTCPCVEWTILAGREGTGCSVWPKVTCSRSGSCGYTLPKPPRSLVCRMSLFCSLLGIGGKHLWKKRKKNISIMNEVHYARKVFINIK